MRSLFKLSVLVLTIGGIVSCSHKEIFFDYDSFANAEWDRDNPAVFNVKIEDNAQPYNVSIELRNNDDYPFSNIWLFIDYKTPDGNNRTDTIGANLADDYGKWYGKGLSLYNLSIPYENTILFPDTGVYIYSIHQGMRENPLKGISDIGIKVSKKSVE
ncbi:MAG: gliding motility lipoprotein GldH [Candidatus Azobacteroides sp.]|nr:gliding motility lipoprotein GldH [Candidatus Azobacteroides sp.]